MPQYIQKFKASYPHVAINFGLGKNKEMKEHIKTGAIDFGIGPDEGDLEEFEKISLYSGSFKLYGDIKHASFIVADCVTKEVAFFKKTYREKFRKDPVIALEVGSWEVIANLVSYGLGIGYIPDYIAEKKNLQPINLGLPAYTYSIVAFYPKAIPLRKSSRLFIDLLIS